MVIKFCKHKQSYKSILYEKFSIKSKYNLNRRIIRLLPRMKATYKRAKCSVRDCQCWSKLPLIVHHPHKTKVLKNKPMALCIFFIFKNGRINRAIGSNF